MAEVNQAAHKEWTLKTLGGEKIEAENPPTMKFSGGKLSIFGGVNRLSGSYALVGGSVTMGEILSTKMAGPPELMALENKFAAILKQVNGFHVHGNTLELLSNGEAVATFQSGE
jgi:heat shock protein HslJ